MSKKIQKGLIFLIFNLIIVATLFFLCEGLASFILFLQTVTASPPVAERLHTQYDETLGWVNRPNILIADMYGPGRDLQTNRQGFRNRQEFSRGVPADKIRIICSGDSFTLGYGVGNDETWCQQLSRLDERLQTVNMGQGGYGIDQAYLWYKRDGAQLAHHIHLFSFITTDFERMQQREFLGYGKPLLRVEAEELIVDNVPVPERAFYVPWLTHNREAIRQLTSVRLLSQLFAQADAAPEAGESDGNSAPEVVAAEILKDLLRLNAAKSSTLVLVYLPTFGDYQSVEQSSTKVWQEFLELAARDTGVIYIDMIEAFRKLPPEQVQKMFIPEGALEFPGAAGHYSAEGHKFVAKVLYGELLALPEALAKLDKLGQ